MDLTHTEPCGCVYIAVDVPDDQGWGQGWDRQVTCTEHAVAEDDADG